MRSQWTGASVDLDRLFLAVERFFVDRSLGKIREADRRKRLLLALVPSEAGKKPRLVRVKILGKSRGFEIDFSVDKAYGFLAKTGLLSTMFGAGFALRGRIDDTAFFERLEEEFWAFMEDTVAQLRT